MSPRRCATLDRVTVTPLYPRGSHTSSPWPSPESVLDHAVGRFMTHNLADYHFPVHADAHDIDLIFVDEHDEVVNPLGAKGLGEIGVVGVAAAIANAIYHATGKRVRDLPITLDKLLRDGTWSARASVRAAGGRARRAARRRAC